MASGGTWGCNRNENGTGSYWGMFANWMQFNQMRDSVGGINGILEGEEIGEKLKALTQSISDTKQESCIPQFNNCDRKVNPIHR